MSALIPASFLCSGKYGPLAEYFARITIQDLYEISHYIKDKDSMGIIQERANALLMFLFFKTVAKCLGSVFIAKDTEPPSKDEILSLLSCETIKNIYINGSKIEVDVMGLSQCQRSKINAGTGGVYSVDCRLYLTAFHNYHKSMLFVKRVVPMTTIEPMTTIAQAPAPEPVPETAPATATEPVPTTAPEPATVTEGVTSTFSSWLW